MKNITNKKKKIKGKEGKAKEGMRVGVGECGFCTVLACPPHPTHIYTISLSYTL